MKRNGAPLNYVRPPLSQITSSNIYGVNESADVGGILQSQKILNPPVTTSNSSMNWPLIIGAGVLIWFLMKK